MARQRLDPGRVLHAAIDYIDEHGIRALTMRRLGATLGVEAMALYRHVPGRDELLDGVVRELIDGLFEDELMTEDFCSWEDYLQRVANSMRRLALDHPRIFPLVATQPPEAAWLRPPLRSVRWVEHFLTTLVGFGFSDEQAVIAYKAFTSFLLGDLLLQVSALGAVLAPEVDVEAGSAGDAAADVDDSLRDFPSVRRLQDRLAEDQTQREFDDGLDDLIERIRALGS